MDRDTLLWLFGGLFAIIVLLLSVLIKLRSDLHILDNRVTRLEEWRKIRNGKMMGEPP